MIDLKNSGLKIPFKVITNGEVIYSADKVGKLLEKLDKLNDQLIEEIEEFVSFLKKAADE